MEHTPRQGRSLPEMDGRRCQARLGCAGTGYVSGIQDGHWLAGKQPKTLITDGAPNFHEAYEKEFWTNKIGNRTEHIREIAFNGERHNNKMERMNGEIRDRERVMRGLETKDTAILKGYQLFHNYIRPHMALDGATPADLAGIKVEGNDKWLTLIQNAAENKSNRAS